MTDSEIVLLLTKLAPAFVYPLGLVIILSIIGLLLAAHRRRLLALTACGFAAVWLWVASMPIFADWAIATLEHQYPAVPLEQMPDADVAIVLGGAVSQPAPPRVEVDFNKSIDRVFYAAKLFHAERVKSVLVAGGNVPWRPSVVPEAELIRSLLIDWGRVPAEAIEITTESRNTYENALEIKELWEKRPFDSALLVTSAAHMPRAMAVFEKAGLPVSAATTDIEALKGVPWTPLRLLPDASSLSMTTLAMKEWLGYLAYQARGYI
jgi:uncharacterized SAM-binding protein YcdF (DUF218 family)